MNPRAPSPRDALLSVTLAFAVALTACRASADPAAGATLQSVGEDLIVARSNVSVTSTVPGDAMLAGGQIDFSGVAGGDYLGAGGEQRIAGSVTGSVRAAAGEIVLAGDVGRNVTLAGGRIELQSDATVAENAYLAGGQIVLAGTVNGGIRAAGGEVTLDGPVGGDVGVQAGRLYVGPGARIAGDLTYRVPEEEVTIDPAAQIGGQVVALPPPPEQSGMPFFRILWHLGFLAAGAVALALLPRLGRAGERVLAARFGAAAGFGLVWVLGLPLALLVVAATVVGIPLALIGLALYLISLYLGRSIVALWLGRQMLGSRVPAGRGGLVLLFLAGGAALVVAGFIPIVGPLVTIASTVVGLGAAFTVLLGRDEGAGGTATDH